MAKLCEEERKWHEYQKARLRSLSVRLEAESELLMKSYPELPGVPLAGLLPPPSEEPLEISR